MKEFTSAILIILACAGAACGSLGDNDEKIGEFYGELNERHLLDDGRVTILYHKDRYLLFVIFEHHRSVLERYSRVDARELSEKEISRFLKANAVGTSWTESDALEKRFNAERRTSNAQRPMKEQKERRWQRSDGRAVATYGKVDERPALTVKFKKS